MNSNYLATTIGMVDDDIVAEAANAKVVRRNTIWLRMGIAAACAACVLGSAVVGAYAYFTPVSYVSLDVNPSIEYSLNTFDRVLSVKGVNDDGKIVLEKIELTSLKNKAIDQAVRETISAIAEQGYFLKDTEGGVVIAVSGNQQEKSEKLSAQLKAAVKRVAEEEALDIEVESMAVGEARVQEAKRLGVTPGKLNLVEKLKESAQNADDIDIEEWLNKSVKDIMKETKANKDLDKAKESDADQSVDNNENMKEDSDVVSDSGKPGKDAKNNSANKSDKATDNGSDKTNNSNNGNNAKSDNDAEKNNSSDGTGASDNNNGKKADKPTNNGQSKKADSQGDSDDDDSGDETSETDSDKGNSADKSNNSGKNNSADKSNNSGKNNSAKK